MRKIVVPIDFSETASHALDFAIDFSHKVDGQILLLHVLEVPPYLFAPPEEIETENPKNFFNEQFIRKVEQHLDEWTKRAKLKHKDVTYKIRFGHPYEHISKEIISEKADWVIMGSKGASGLSEILLGSNAERVIRYSECPVFVIKGPSRIDSIKNIVFASDLSEEQDWMTFRAKVIQQLFGVEMSVLKVRTPKNLLSEQAVHTQLKEFADRNHFKNTTLNSIEANKPDIGILEFANKIKAGLIVIGTHGRTGIPLTLSRSRAEDLANHSEIPVLTYKLPSTPNSTTSKH